MALASLRDEYLALVRRNGLEDYMRRRDAVKVDPRIALDAVEERLVASGIDPSRAKRIIKRVGADLKPERGYDPLIEEMNSKIIAALEEMGIPISVPILATSYPHGSLNARACMTPAGILLLLNDGTLAALDQTAKIFSHFIRFTPFSDGGPSRDSTGAIKAEPDPGAREYREDETLGALADTVFAYLFFDGAGVKWLGVDGGSRSLIASSMSTSACTFILAHEYGHVIGSHLNRPRNVSSYITRSDPRPEWLEKSHSQELTADSIGAVVALSVAAGGLAAKPTAEARAEISCCAGGIFLYFCLDRLINIVRRKLRERIYERAKQVVPPLQSMSTHPTAEERMKNVWNVFARVGDSAEMMRAVDILFQRLEEPTVERVWDLLVKAYTKGS